METLGLESGDHDCPLLRPIASQRTPMTRRPRGSLGLTIFKWLVAPVLALTKPSAGSASSFPPPRATRASPSATSKGPRDAELHSRLLRRRTVHRQAFRGPSGRIDDETASRLRLAGMTRAGTRRLRAHPRPRGLTGTCSPATCGRSSPAGPPHCPTTAVLRDARGDLCPAHPERSPFVAERVLRDGI